MEKLKLTLLQQELKYKDATYQNTFTGVQAVETFLHQMALLPEEAITFALFLFNANIFNYVPATDLKNSTFHNSDTEVYCLQCYRYPNVLNSYCIWNEPAGDATKLVARLDKMLNTLECNSLNEQGKMDYDRLMKLADFPKLEEAMCQLQTIDLEIFKNENEWRAFAINLYRLMFCYGILKYGIIGLSESECSSFMQDVKFNVNGHLFSFQEWTNGILWANKPVKSLSKKPPLGWLDARHKYTLKQLDYQIHFAMYAGLPFGSTSSLPFRQFSADHMEAELDEAARIYCDDVSNIAINANTEPMLVKISCLFSYYWADFGEDEKGLLEIINLYLDSCKRVEMKKIMANSKNVKIAYTGNKWDTMTLNWPLYRKEQFQKN